MSYLENVINASGGHAAPAETLTSDREEAPEGYHYMPDGTLMRDDAHEDEAAASDPCWEGYVQIGMKEKDGQMVPNCVPAGDAAIAATAGAKPAPKKDQVEGSSKNAKGSASGGKSITFSKKVEESLKIKAEEHNKKHGDNASKKVSLRALKAVYRRGAGAYSSSHRPDQNRNSWAMARVNAFLHLLSSGRPKNSKYTTDNDLLPASHPKSPKKNASSLTAAALIVADTASKAVAVEILSRDQYESDEHAIFSLAEYSDLSYDAIPSIRAAWLRGLQQGDSPFNRAVELATELYESVDADLLPKREED